MLFRKLIMMAALAAATPALAEQRTSVIALPSDVVGANHVVSTEVIVSDEALVKFEAHEKKAAEKRAERKLAAYDPAAGRPDRDEYNTLPFAAMFPLVMEDVTRDWGLTSGRPVKLKVRISSFKTADAAMAILLAPSKDKMTGLVSVLDAADGDREIGAFLIDVENMHSGWGGMLLRGGGIRQRLAEEFALETSRMLTGRKKKGKVKTAGN